MKKDTVEKQLKYINKEHDYLKEKVEEYSIHHKIRSYDINLFNKLMKLNKVLKDLLHARESKIVVIDGEFIQDKFKELKEAINYIDDIREEDYYKEKINVLIDYSKNLTVIVLNFIINNYAYYNNNSESINTTLANILYYTELFIRDVSAQY